PSPRHRPPLDARDAVPPGRGRGKAVTSRNPANGKRSLVPSGPDESGRARMRKISRKRIWPEDGGRVKSPKRKSSRRSGLVPVDVPMKIARCRFVDGRSDGGEVRSEVHTSELQSLAYLVCRLLLE